MVPLLRKPLRPRFRVRILTAEDRWHAAPGLTSVEAAVLVNFLHIPRPAAGDKARLPTEMSDEPLVPFVNHGRWLVSCPRCPSAMHASKVDPRFMCAECGSGGRWHPVVWPADAERIERALACRPSKTNRNWSPPETVELLVAENKARGVR